jgi:HupE / UreJ protein
MRHHPKAHRDRFFAAPAAQNDSSAPRADRRHPEVCQQHHKHDGRNIRPIGRGGREKWRLVIVGVFAFAHGHAHGSEMPASADALAFSVGFVIATGMLHALGIAIGLLIKWPVAFGVVRAMGGLAALFGLYLIVEHVTNL